MLLLNNIEKTERTSVWRPFHFLSVSLRPDYLFTEYDLRYTDLTSEAIGLLKSLIAIPSLSRDEEKAADYLQNYIEMQGMATGRKGNNVWCLSPMFDLKKPTLLLNSHIDTVKPVNGWRKDPFKPTLESNGKLYGLGSNDAGASVVSLLQVFLTLCRTTQPTI